MGGRSPTRTHATSMSQSEASKSERRPRSASRGVAVRTVFLHFPFLVLLVLLVLLLGAPQPAESRRRGQRLGEPEELPNADAMLMDAGQVQCEPIQIGFCADMAYQSTRMPNFFGDTNQIEALARSRHYQTLATSKCSPHVRAYVCELLTPVCLEHSQEAMKRFEIYPCRSFCRRVQLECEEELARLNEQLFSEGSMTLLPGFACEKLPFESNGGNGSFRGPCHEMPDQAGQQQQAGKSSYRPYQPAVDANNPPFITDTSRIDPNLIKPIPNVFELGPGDEPAPFAPKTPKHESSPVAPRDGPAPDKGKPEQPQPGFLGQLHLMSHSLALMLVRHSNALSIVTVLILLVVLFSKRLRRLKCYLKLSPSSSTKSSNSTSSRHQLYPKQSKLDQFPAGSQPAAPGQQGRFQVSPSASTRSLMLIAGDNKRPPSHQLVEPAGGVTPSQKLLYGMQNQRTLINVNGTLDQQVERYRQLATQWGNFKPTPTAKTFVGGHDKQQLFNTLDSHSSSNQYEYIQVAGERSPAGSEHQIAMRARQQQQQQRLYSNILLSSPSHQVLLFDEPQQIQARPALQQAPARQLAGRQMASASNLSPYDSPSSLAGSCQLGQMEARHQRSFQRRASNQAQPAEQQQRTGFGSAGRAAYAASSASSCSSSNSNSNSNSAYSALSPASSTNAPPTPQVLSAGRSSSRRPL